MARTIAALAALALSAGTVRAADDLDPKTQAAIQAATQAAVDKAVAQAEERLRADVQTSQATRELDAAVATGPKLEFLELDGYFRLRGDVYDDLGLKSLTDAAGLPLWPASPLADPNRSTLAGANLRLRIEPTLNVSELVRVRAQIDVLDNYALGSSEATLFDVAGNPYRVPVYGTSRAFLLDGKLADRAAILVKRAWGEVQTPVGLLSFGRMPAGWGLGMLQNPGSALDDDYGDTVDRIQFAIPPLNTPVGPLTVAPSFDFDSEGAQLFDTRSGAGAPVDVDKRDDARTWGLKVARLETEDELRRKLERGETSIQYGAWYQYKAQDGAYQEWLNPAATTTTLTFVKRDAWAHVLDVWARWQKGSVKAEVEAAGIFGRIGDADLATPAKEELILRQYGLVATLDVAIKPKKLSVGGEFGIASGDDAPGFGNDPGRPRLTGQPTPYPYGVLDGPQWGDFGGNFDRDLRNFRFNPAYRADVVLFRQILGGVTDAFYVKPKLRWDVMPGISVDGAIVVSAALHGESTPSSTGPGTGVTGLGVEGDAKVTYSSGDGFKAWVEYGLLQPLDALKTDPDFKLARAHALHVGLAVVF